MTFFASFEAPFTKEPSGVIEPPFALAKAGIQKAFVVDDDYFARSIIGLMLEEAGLVVESFESCEAFLGGYHPHAEACLVLDVHFAGMGGLELLERVKSSPRSLPVVIVSGSSGISEAVQSMKAGAFDFIEKPVGQTLLLASVRRALRHARSVKEHHDLHEALLGLLAALTPREREIMQLVVAGHPSKNIAVDLGISQRTVENHRASIMHKTGAKSLPALGRMAESLSL